MTIAIQLALLAITTCLVVYTALSARRAASFDMTRDFDALAAAVARLQSVARSAQMSKVRQAALPPEQPHLVSHPQSHDQLRAYIRARDGASK
ncbi:MAG: hypothetical protein ACREXV_19965 [Polaromonas sp.]